MTAQPAQIDLADLGPGVAWAFEFDENGRGRLLEGNSSFDLTHGRRFVWVHLILGNVRTRDWIGAQHALPPEAREVFLSKDRHPSLHWGGGSLVGNAPRRPPRRPNGGDGGDRSAFRFMAAVSPDGTQRAPPWR
jgi:hypothetical protein